MIAPILAALVTGAPLVVLPARGDKPPPRDPTLMRLTETVAAPIGAALGVPATIASAALAEQAWPTDREPSRDLAILVSAERAVTLVLSPDQTSLALKIYLAKRGIERELSLPCKWAAGLVSCDLAALAELAPAQEKAAPPKRAPASAKAGEAAPSPEELALGAMDRRVAKCRSKGWGELAANERPSAMSARFRVDEDGAIKDVRLDPSGFSDVPAFACMARVLESTTLTPGIVGPEPRVRALPLP